MNNKKRYLSIAICIFSLVMLTLFCFSVFLCIRFGQTSANLRASIAESRGDAYLELFVKELETDLKNNTFYLSATIFFALASFGATILFILSFIFLNPRLFRKSTYTDIADNISKDWEKNKTERTERKRPKTETEKERLKAKLEELEKESKE